MPTWPNLMRLSTTTLVIAGPLPRRAFLLKTFLIRDATHDAANILLVSHLRHAS